MSWQEEYFRRVRPVVGDAFSDRRAAIWDLGSGYLAAEALARTGLRRQLWLDGGQATGAFCRSLGRGYAGRARSAALEEHCRRHNTFESQWELETVPPDAAELRRRLQRGQLDLVLAAGDEGAGDVARAAVDSGTPLVMTFVPLKAPAAVQVVWHPQSRVDPAAVVNACAALARVPQLDLDRADAHLDGLEARSQALSVVKWLLLRDSQQREDLEQPIIHGDQCVLIRGQSDWPWAVRFLSPARDLAALLDYLQRGPGRYRPPLALLEDERVLVIGLGTASLFCAEAGLLARQLVLVDCKEVTPVNPVRQVYSTEHIGQPKARALADILAARLEPNAAWSEQQEGQVRYLTSARWSLGAVELGLSLEDELSLDRFDALLDEVQPTLAIVGMGRTHDDNFAATSALRRRGIRHITPSAFPGVTHYKHILTDGAEGPCYDCIQGHLPAVDSGAGPALSPAEREMFYGGSQPATLAETYPSAHSLLRLAVDLALPRGARPGYLLRELGAERPCFVGANRAEQSGDAWLYGVDRPFGMVTFGVADVARAEKPVRCACGRINAPRDAGEGA